MILNRLQKNWKKLSIWAKRQKIEAFRLYDRDIPEYPFIVDVYSSYLVVYDKSVDEIDKEKNHLPNLLHALQSGLNFNPQKIVIKKRNRQQGLAQYEKLEGRNEFIAIREEQAIFLVNLYDYLDTGLFLDHRPMRQKIKKEIGCYVKEIGASPLLLNLFCYTGSMSVIGALAGARVTSIDMSLTYLEWAKKNFSANQLKSSEHEFIQADVLQWLRNNKESNFDFIFLDPPTFSNSKRMIESFEVERDQEIIIQSAMANLSKTGVLYFSNNKRNFKISVKLLEQFQVRNITEQSIPMDCHDKKIHHCFEIRPRVEK